MAYVLVDYTEVNRPLIAIFRLGIRDGATYYEAAPVVGMGVYRDMHPASRGSENVLAPITAEDMDTQQSHLHDDRQEVMDSHVPEHVIQDPSLYSVLTGLGRAAVHFVDGADRWELGA